MNERVLLVDDDPSVHEVVRAYLEREGYIVYSAFNGLDGLRLSQSREPALIVLDRMLPDISGDDLCGEVRDRSETAILMLTGRTGEDDRIGGLELGADDYLAKPFSPRELVARVKALLRRSRGREAAPGKVLSFDDGGLRVDTVQHRVFARGELVELTPSEYRLLVALCEYPGRVYSRFELINRVRGYEFAGYERTIDAHVKNLRKKIEREPGERVYVQTVAGVGYRLGVSRS